MADAAAPVEAVVEPHVHLNDRQIKVLHALVAFMELAGANLTPVYRIGINGLPPTEISGPFGFVKVNHE